MGSTKSEVKVETTSKDGSSIVLASPDPNTVPTIDINNPLPGAESTPEEEGEQSKVPSLEDLQAQIASLKADNATLHRTANKASSDAAEWKKKYQSKLSVDEQRANQDQERENYTKSLEKELAVMKNTITLQSKGFSDEEAKAIAEARYSGDIDAACDLENQHYEKIRQQLEADYQKKVNALMQPESGNAGIDFQKRYNSAMNNGDRIGAISALLQQSNIKLGG